MSKERFLTVLIPIKDDDCESGTYTVGTLPSPIAENINKIYIMDDGTYRRLWYNNGTLEYHAVVDREFPYLGDPLEIFDFTYNATRMGQAPTISAQGIMRFVDSGGNTLDGLWSQECHVTFNGENLYLKQIPNASKSNEDARYKYDMDFVSEDVVLERVYLYDVVTPFITEKPISESSVFSFYGDASELAKRINTSLIHSGLASLVRKYVGYPTSSSNIVPYLTYEQWTTMNVNPSSLIGVVFANAGEMQVFGQSIYAALNADYNQYLQQYIYQNTNGDYTVNGYKVVFGIDKYGEVSSSEEKLVSIENATIHEALQQFFDTFELQYYITKEKDGSGNFTGNTLIVVGDCEHDFADWDEDNDDYVRDDDGVPTTVNPFDYGSTKELLSKEKTNTTEKIVTRITGVGSTENIPWYYPNPCPDGWIKPLYTRSGVVLQEVTVDYPVDEGTTTAEYALYEKFLKNRIGKSFSKGKMIGVTYANEYKFKYEHTESGDFLIVLKYEINLQSYTPQSVPCITLNLDYNPNASGCTKVIASLARNGEYVYYYDSSQTYQDPNNFQNLFLHGDGSVYMNLQGGAYYNLDIEYVIPSANVPLSQQYDFEGYHYPSEFIHNQGSIIVDKYAGENFYTLQNLVPFVELSGEPPVYDLEDIGYSVNGEASGKVSPIPRVKWKNYKDLSTNTIYTCNTSTANNPVNNEPSNPFTINPPMLANEWLNTFVTMALRLYLNNGWYLDGNRIQLEDYGLELLTQGGTSFSSIIFDKIEFQRLKWVTPQPNLMPEVYIKTDGERRFYVAHDYYDKESSTLLAGTADAAIGEQQVGSLVRNPLYKDEETDTDDKHYDFENEFVKNLPHEHIENFDDVKPTIKEQKAYVKVEITREIIADWANQYNNYFVFDDGDYVQAPSTYDSSIKTYYMLLRIDVVEEFAYDEYDSDEIWESNDAGSINGEYKHPYFFAKLRPMGFNIFDMALQEDMVLSMTTGNCGACNFKIGVDENYRKNPVQLWEYDVYDGDSLQATKLYDKGSLRRYINLTGLYYNKNGVFEAIAQYSNDIELGENSGEMPFNFDDNKGIYHTYNYTGVSVESGMVGVTKKAGNTHIEGDVVTSGRFLDEQQDTSENYVWVALFKDTDSYGTIMPSAVPNYNDPNYNLYMRPKSIVDVHIEADPSQGFDESTYTDDEDNADKFVLTNIRLPQVYLRRAEHELSRKLVKYMYDNNFQKFNFNIKFSRIYIEENPHTDEGLNENSVLYVDFNRAIYRQYVKNYTYKMVHTEALPEITVSMNEKLSVSRTLEQRRRRDGKISDGRTSSQISSVVNRMRDKIESRTINKDNNQIMSGNIIIQGENTSLVELARMRNGNGGDSGSSSQQTYVSDKNYVYEWATLESSITITHNLGKYPSVSIVDTAGSEIIGDITYVNENSVTLSFSARIRGKAYFN